MKERVIQYSTIILGLLLFGGCTKEAFMRYDYGYNFESGPSVLPMTILELVVVISFLLFPVFWILQAVSSIQKRMQLRYFLAGTLIAISVFFVPRHLPTRSFMDGLHDRVAVEFSQEELLQIRDKIIDLDRKKHSLDTSLAIDLTQEEELKLFGSLFSAHPKLLSLGTSEFTRVPIISVEEDSVRLRWFGSMGNPRGIEILRNDRELESDDFTAYRKVYSHVWVFRWYS